MARFTYEPRPVIVSLDDESKELIRELVNAVNRIADIEAPVDDVSFADTPKRLVEVTELGEWPPRYEEVED